MLGASFHTPSSCVFVPNQDTYLGFRLDSQLGCTQEAIDQCFPLTSMSLCLSLKKKSINISLGQNLNNEYYSLLKINNKPTNHGSVCSSSDEYLPYIVKRMMLAKKVKKRMLHKCFVYVCLWTRVITVFPSVQITPTLLWFRKEKRRQQGRGDVTLMLSQWHFTEIGTQ